MYSAASTTQRVYIPLIAWFFFAVTVLSVNTGCSVYMAAKQPRERDLSVLSPGTPRGYVIAELGAPVWSGEKVGEKVDVFTFTQGYSTGARSARALFHGISDVFTLGLWEVISTPVEGAFSGTEMKFEVTYNKDDQVKTAKNLTGAGSTSRQLVLDSHSEQGEPIPNQSNE